MAPAFPSTDGKVGWKGSSLSQVTPAEDRLETLVQQARSPGISCSPRTEPQRVCCGVLGKGQKGGAASPAQGLPEPLRVCLLPKQEGQQGKPRLSEGCGHIPWTPVQSKTVFLFCSPYKLGIWHNNPPTSEETEAHPSEKFLSTWGHGYVLF